VNTAIFLNTHRLGPASGSHYHHLISHLADIRVRTRL